MSWIEKKLKKNTVIQLNNVNISDSIWTKCSNCNQILYREELKRNFEVCPKCDYHMQITARIRLHMFLDKKNKFELFSKSEPKDILNFKDLKKYKDRLITAKKNTNEKDALIVMKGTLYGMPIVTVSFEFTFIGGSMSSVVGSTFVLAVEQAIKDNCSLVCFSSSVGARIQEGLMSLMQMAKVNAVLAKFRERRLLYISVLTNPTMGGVSASLAMLGDLNIAEPKALIGFAGYKVIEKIVHEKLPIGFQRSEFLLKKGIIDLILHRKEIRFRIACLISKLTNQLYPKN